LDDILDLSVKVAVDKLNNSNILSEMNKQTVMGSQPSRQAIFSWIHSLLGDVAPSLKAE
jgi:hypothetical protein